MKKSNTLLSEIYSKCLRQENDITQEISKIINKTYPINTIDRIKEKVQEKLDNLYNSISLIEKMVNELSVEERGIWNGKKENLILTYKTLNSRLENCIKKLKKSNYNFDDNIGDSKKSDLFGNNINNLSQENQSWKTILKLSNEIETNASLVNGELDNQSGILGNINKKISGIFGNLHTSHKSTDYMIKRGKGDTYLCIFLGFLTIAIMFFCYYYLRPKIRAKFH